MAFETYKLDALQYRTLPSFSWDALLKLSQVELNLTSDPEMYLFLENSEVASQQLIADMRE
jgi:hypothetical protein